MTFEGFEEFSPVRGRYTPLITVGESGGIGISAGFSRTYGINSASYPKVKLYFNRAEMTVGIRFLSANDVSSDDLVLKEVPRGGAHINAKPFWMRFNVDHKTYAGRYQPERLQKDGVILFVFKLKTKLDRELEKSTW
jgi:hypothetical protein